MPHALSIPQQAAPDELRARAEELEKRRTEYVYKSPPTIPGVAFLQGPVERMPDELPSRWWTFKVSLVTARVILNFSRFTPTAVLRSLRLLFESLFHDLRSRAARERLVDRVAAENDVAAIASGVRAAHQRRLAGRRSTFSRALTPAGSEFEELDPRLSMYRDMYTSRFLLPMPYIGNIFMQDRVFARLRIAGYNPISLFRIVSANTLPFSVDADRMPVDGDSLPAAAVEKRLYALDFSDMATVVQKQSRPEQRVYPARALFAVAPSGRPDSESDASSNSSSGDGGGHGGGGGGGELQPVAIEIQGAVVYPPRPDEPFCTRWAIAKTVVNNCDALHHELVAHLGRTHLLVEPFVAATMRQLPRAHPVHALLRPHFEGTVFINDTASRRLVAPGGDVDTVFAGDIAAVMQWCGELVVENRFNASMPDVELGARGVDNDVLGGPYREDALAHFDALLRWVRAFLAFYYASDADVAADAELQAWVAELVDEKRGRVKDFGDRGDGVVRSVGYLERALAFVIFSASVQHAAVNFPQRDLMSYAPAVAGAVWADPMGERERDVDSGDKTASLEEWARTLTPLEVAVEQVEILNVIGAVYHTQLGRYRRGEMPRVQAIQTALAEYKERLATIDRRIKAREARQELRYEYLRPCNVPQSINI